MSAEPRLLIAAQPTRGVDVGSIEFIHSRIVDARDKGAAVLLVSADLDEILLAVRPDRRRPRRPRRRGDAGAGANRQEIGRLMAGGGH